MTGTARAALISTITTLLASCHYKDEVLIRVTHYESPYGKEETKAHTVDFVRAFAKTTGHVPRLDVNVYWRETTYAPHPAGGYRTDNGLHVAFDATLAQSALWHELAHIALQDTYGDSDWTHTRTDVWDMVETRYQPNLPQ